MARAFETRPARAPLPAAAQRPAASTRTVPPAADFPQLARRLHLGAPIQCRAGDGPGRDFSDIAGPSRPSLPGGLPAGLRADVEARSGLPMDDVRVHRNSPKPRTIGALAYAQGRDIHLGPGQEKHLAHEAWHVVQQKQGRVRTTGSISGMPLNDETGLEREADGAPAARVCPSHTPGTDDGILQGVFYSRLSHAGTFVNLNALPKLYDILKEQILLHGCANYKKFDVMHKFQSMENNSHKYELKDFFKFYPNLPAVVKDALLGVHTEETVHVDSRKKVDKAFGDAGIGLEGQAISGFYPKDKKYLANESFSKKRDFAGFRTRQVLHHFSEVMFHHLKETAEKKDDPIEIQVAYWIDKAGNDRLSISANNRDAQLLLHGMSSEIITTIVNKISKSSSKSKADQRAGKSARKLKSIKGANVKRRERDKNKREKREDMDLAEKLAKMLLRRDFSVAINDAPKKHKVHAEQVLKSAITRQKGELKDVAGVKIRCAACTMELGVDEKQTQLTGLAVSGKVYKTQSEKLPLMPARLKDKNIHVHPGNPNRNESLSELDSSVETDASFGFLQTPEKVQTRSSLVSNTPSPGSVDSSFDAFSPIRVTEQKDASESESEQNESAVSDDDRKENTSVDLSELSDSDSDYSRDEEDDPVLIAPSKPIDRPRSVAKRTISKTSGSGASSAKLRPLIKASVKSSPKPSGSKLGSAAKLSRQQDASLTDESSSDTSRDTSREIESEDSDDERMERKASASTSRAPQNGSERTQPARRAKTRALKKPWK